MPTESNPVLPTSFRLDVKTLTRLDRIAEYHSDRANLPCSRTDALRLLIALEAARIGATEEPRKKSRQNS